MNTRQIAAEYRLAYWAQIMQNQSESGLSIRAFCEQSGFHENTYFYWQKKLREAACEELSKINNGTASMLPATFAEVKLSRQSTLPVADIEQNRVCIEAAGIKITAESGYPAEKLALLLRAVI